MNFVSSPCKDCSDRHFNCHSTCPTYGNWKAEENRKNAEVDAKKAIMAGFIEVSSASYAKHLRRKAQGARV